MILPRIDGDILVSLTVVIGLLALSSLVSVYVYGRFAKRARGKPSQSLPAEGPHTPVDRAVLPLTEGQPGRTGILVLSDNHEAYAARALSARAAGRSLDMMYYLWRGDLTGGLLIADVLAAADRGVRVRLLLDDINTRGLDPEYLALTGHPGIEVRLFNPAKNRTASLRRGAEMLLRLVTVTRRMHNKAWIVDGRYAIIGGRNIGDTYFDAARDFNSSDMDAALVGPAVAEVETVFDTYWNSPLTLPIRSLWKDRVADLVGFRASLAAQAKKVSARRYLHAALGKRDFAAFLAQDFVWTDQARIVSDPPEKTQRGERDRWLIHTLAPTLAEAKRQVRVTTAYFVPGSAGVEGLCALAASDVLIMILTNSLASTNQVTVHGGYSEARPRLLRAGIRLFELRPRIAERARTALYKIEAASLHTKNFTVDGRIGFIGSFNFDLRSAYLNTEMGLLVEDATIALRIDQVFELETTPEWSYEVHLRDDALVWTAGDLSYEDEPEASRVRRLIAGIVRYLPIKRQL